MKIFISYANEDKKEAGTLHSLLSLLGFQCFLAHEDIKKGELWRAAIVKELKAADVFVVLLSEYALKSAWVQQECGMAHILRERRKKPHIIPVTPGSAPPGCLSEYQAERIDLSFLWSKLQIGHEFAGKIAKAIVSHFGSVETVKGTAIGHLSGAAIQDFEFILDFLYSSNSVTFEEFLKLVERVGSHSRAPFSDYIMWRMYRLLEKYKKEIDGRPDWVKYWNGRIHEPYQKYKAEERRRQEETARKMAESTTKLLEHSLKKIEKLETKKS